VVTGDEMGWSDGYRGYPQSNQRSAIENQQKKKARRFRIGPFTI